MDALQWEDGGERSGGDRDSLDGGAQNCYHRGDESGLLVPARFDCHRMRTVIREVLGDLEPKKTQTYPNQTVDPKEAVLARQ
jgi:hypothetical protein